MELLRLKRRLAVAGRGHKLLRDKLDELMRRFLELVSGFKTSHHEVEQELIAAYRNFIRGRAGLPINSLTTALTPSPDRLLKVNLTWENVMSVRVPKLSLDGEIKWDNYGFHHSGGDLDLALARFALVLPKLIKLGEQKKALELLALDIEKTRRRVNALEYVLIPNLEEAIRTISMKLSEAELANQTRLMKVKEMMEAKQAY
jgi:V/A-type H+-transporting ATPase subunit D